MQQNWGSSYAAAADDAAETRERRDGAPPPVFSAAEEQFLLRSSSVICLDLHSGLQKALSPLNKQTKYQYIPLVKHTEHFSNSIHFVNPSSHPSTAAISATETFRHKNQIHLTTTCWKKLCKTEHEGKKIDATREGYTHVRIHFLRATTTAWCLYNGS